LAGSAEAPRIVVVPRYGSPTEILPAGVEQSAPAAGRARWSFNAMCLAARGCDIVFCGHLFAAPLAALLAWFSSRPLWLQAHGIEAWQAPNRAVRIAVEQAKLVTAVSRYTRKRFLEWADIDPARVRVLPNTISPSWAKEPRSRSLQERYGLPGKRVILTVARLSAAESYKGHDRIIRAMPAILSRHNAVYLIVGDGDDMPRLKALADKTGVTDRVRFTGRVMPAELPAHFSLADVFAMPSMGEGFGIAFIEAAACGVPVIAGNSDGSVDALAEGRIGRLIDPHDQNALIEAVDDALSGRLLSDPEQMSRFEFTNFRRQVSDLVMGLITQ
jgi:phosphatidyl-myo-inositol dimannoside synthase